MPSSWVIQLITLFLMGYTDFRDGDGTAEDIQIILLDIKSGGARLTKGQQAIAQAIKEGKVRFETLRIDFED